MASAGLDDVPVYSLTNAHTSARALLLTPATRWRVIVEQHAEETEDAIRQAVVGLRAAGVTSSTRIADLLQLPEPLVQHLLAEAEAHKTVVEQSGALTTVRSRTAWLYRDGLTGELWPEPGNESPPLDIRFLDRRRGRLLRGSAGRPVSVDCLRVDSTDSHGHDPTAVELAYFSKASREVRRRTAVVSPGSPCLVASRVVKTPAGWQVESRESLPHVAVSRKINQLSGVDRALRRWLDEQPAAIAATDSPLARASEDLRSAAAALDNPADRHQQDQLIARAGRCLTRFVDHYSYEHDPDLGTTDAVANHRAAALGRALALPPTFTDRIARGREGTVERVVGSLLVAELTRTPSDVEGVKLLAVAFLVWLQVAETRSTDRLRELVDRTLTLCDHAHVERKEDDGAQA